MRFRGGALSAYWPPPHRGHVLLISALLVVAFVLGPCTARCEPIRLETPSTVVTDGGSELRLPPGVFLPEEDYERLDVELRRLQDAETRLGAENESLRESVKGAGWVWWVGAFTAGAAFGAWVTR